MVRRSRLNVSIGTFVFISHLLIVGGREKANMAPGREDRSETMTRLTMFATWI